ncbi:MMPL family transporter [Actinomadura logoneensis]|uniref:MMPL family transporter n=1 Tax=Actinomadura logoneensis TaxID=2293572 RepID=A0A372JS64_9ACTN|nr:MMPL family transporter [Actinomadura logoneensis]RFU42861.1 MMPL family transporter [Actinomadura logoneensis]
MKRNIAERLGYWSARHRTVAIVGWLAFVVLASVLGGMSGTEKLKPYEQGVGSSARAEKIIDEAGIDDPSTEMVLLHSDDSGALAKAVTDVRARLQASGQAAAMKPTLTGKDPRDRLVVFDIAGDPDKADEHVQPLLDATAAAQRANPGVTIGQFGGTSAGRWFDNAVGNDFKRAEITALPLALGILLVAFGALLAALLPVALAFTAFLASLGLMGAISHVMHVDDSTNSVMLLMGLAVGVDYCLFYLQRERQERALGRDREAALRIAAATSGRSVLVSGLTVMVAMAGMFLTGMGIFEGFALATILVVCAAMLGSVTVLPALLSLLGDKVEFGRVPFLNRTPKRGRRAKGTAQSAQAAQPAQAAHPAQPGQSAYAGQAHARPARQGGRIVGALLRPVLARPGVSAVLATAVLLVLAAPALGLKTQKLDLNQQMPQSEPIAKTYTAINKAFPGSPGPAVVVVKADDINAAPVKQAIAALRKEALATGEMNTPINVRTHGAHVAQIEVPLAGNGTDATSKHALRTLREQVVPHTVAKAGQAEVTGHLAFSEDFNGRLRTSILPVFLFVMGVTFLLMLVFFRSPVIAATAIVLNLLSVGAAYGVMAAVFQHGWGASLVATHPVGALESWIPLFVFVVLFGLSMDYHVFVVSRIREAHDRGLPTTRAVADGVRATAGVVTSAAVIMIATFGIFGTLSMQDFKQLGVGLAVAVLIDATVVRVILLPAVMAMLGRANWWVPRWLGWLPHVSHGEPEAQDRPAAPVLTA